MKPGFLLNLPNREVNPCFESHDPSMMKDPVSGFYYSYSTDSAITSEFQQGIPVRKSRDLINFEYVGTVLSQEAVAEARDNGKFGPTRGFWAPFTEYVNGEYRMYYSATKAFGSSESKIWLAVSDSPEGSFENRGVVVNTWFTDDTKPNGIDPHIIDDAGGNKYLVYGSFFGGIYIKELDPATGLSRNGKETDLGARIAHKPENAAIDGPEGAAILYHEENGYFYLFLSYGWLGENYDIRVGRSRSVFGPYLDFHGKSLDGESYGLKLANSYCFSSQRAFAEEGNGWSFAGFRGPGHGVPFYDPDKGEYFFVHHIRDGAEIFRIDDPSNVNPVSYRMHYMMIRRMYFINEWPVFSPEPYAGESKEPLDAHADPAKLKGDWEWIYMDYDDNSIKISKKETFSLSCAEGVLAQCIDFENMGEAICITGITEDGTAFWGKQRKN